MSKVRLLVRARKGASSRKRRLQESVSASGKFGAFARRGRSRMATTAVEHEHRVTPRELWFDVFVFAFTQVATLFANDTFAGIDGGVPLLAALWRAWRPYAWLLYHCLFSNEAVG
jgi:hypothetical protein